MRAVLLLSALALAGCSHGDAGTSNAAAARSASASAPAHPASAAPTAAPTVTAAERPFEQYQTPGHDGLRWVALYYAVTGTPPDAAAEAKRLDPTYQAATDAFAKRDALDRLGKRLDQAVSDAKANPYVQLPPVIARMPDFDVDHNRYDLTTLIGEGRGLRMDQAAARVEFAANPQLTLFAPPDEATARALEHALSTNPLGRQIRFVVYGKVTGGTLMSGDPDLTVLPSRVVVENYFVDGHTTPLFTATVP